MKKMSQEWKTYPAIADAMEATNYAHFHQIVNQGGQAVRKLSGTAAIVSSGAHVIAGFALVGPKDNGAKAIGRNVAQGRALKALASILTRGSINPVKAPKGLPFIEFGSLEEAEAWVRDTKQGDLRSSLYYEPEPTLEQ